MWTWEEGLEAFLATVRSALDRMDEFDDFVFTCSSAAHYQWVEEVEPELFERMRIRIDEGRWAIVGGWWTQADCNLPSGEGFARQALLGQRYFLERFGRRAVTGYSPDAFGHNGGLPQLLARSGMNAYIFCRPDQEELALPSPLIRWISPDGSSVYAYRVPYHYNMYETSVGRKVDDLARAFHAASALTAHTCGLSALGSEWMLFYGVGNHGGGPTREHIRQIIELDGSAGAPHLLFSDPDTFFRSIDSHRTIPDWHDDLQLNAPGCYSVHSTIKRLNRASEHALVESEIWATIAAIQTGRNADESGLRRAWEQVCFNHFHDLIGGVAIREALDEAINGYGEAISVATSIARTARARIARRIDTRGSGETVIIFNPHSFTIREHVTGELWHDIDKTSWSRPVELRITDDNGIDLNVSVGFTSGKIGRDRVSFTFRGKIPAMGWRTYRLHYGERSSARPTGMLEATDTSIENDQIRVEVDRATGALTSFYCKSHARELLAGPSAVPIAIDDPTDTWGHGVTRFDRVKGEFGDAVVRLVENTPTHATIRVRNRWGSSWVQQDYRLYRDDHHLHVRAKLFWGEERTMLKLQFDVDVENPSSVAEGAYTTMKKVSDGTERPKGRWCAIVGTVAKDVSGLVVADNAKSGYSADGRRLSLSILRSPSYATHDPHPHDEAEDLDFIDAGVQRFEYTLVPILGGGWRSRAFRAAALLSSPPSVLIESSHDGTEAPLNRHYGSLTIQPECVAVTTLKRSWDRDGWIMRLHETSGVACTVKVDFVALGVAWSFDIEPHGVRTFRIVDDTVREVDLVELETGGPQ